MLANLVLFLTQIVFCFEGHQQVWKYLERNLTYHDNYWQIFPMNKFSFLYSGFLEGKIVKRQLGSDLQNNDHLINQWKIISGNNSSIQDLQEITYQCLDVCHDQGLKTE